MISYKPLFDRVTAAASQHGEGRIEAAELQRLCAQIQHKAEDLRPTIMVYGIYNAGKSTLINALIGSEKAKVSDRPETDTVTEYEWQGIRLFDTPGIDAPINHQNVTEAHLKQTEVILFVVSSDGAFDERYIYEHMLRVLQAGKPVILVLNVKSIIDEMVEMQILAKIGGHLSEITSHAGLSETVQKVAVYSINAKSALKGRLENKPKLLESSRIPKLEARIAETMQNVSMKESLSTISTLCLDLLDRLEKAISQDISSYDDNGVAKVIDKIQTNLQRLKSNAERIVRFEMMHFEDALRRLLFNATDQKSLEFDIQQQAITTLQKVQEQIDPLFEAFAESTTQSCRMAISQLETVNLSSQGESPAATSLKSLMGSISSKADAKNIKTVLIAGKKLGLPLLSETSLTTLGKWAATIGKVAPFIIAAIQFLLEIFTNQKEEKRAAERALLVNQKAAELRSSLQDDILVQLYDLITEVEQIMLAPLQAEQLKMGDRLQQLQQEQQAISALRTEVVTISAL